MRKSNYDKHPCIAVSGGENACVQGWNAIAARLQTAVAERHQKKTVLVIECYTGVDEALVLAELTSRLKPVLALDAREAMRASEEIDTLVAPFLGGDDPVFGFLSDLELPEFFDPAKIGRLRRQVEQAEKGLILVAGCGARLVHQGDILVYADLARWEAQLRFRRNESNNLGVQNRALAASLKYKRAFSWIGACATAGNVRSFHSGTSCWTPMPPPPQSWPRVKRCGAGCAMPPRGRFALCRFLIPLRGADNG